MRALISGMGIAGPTLAYWLRAQGWDSTLVEQAPHLRTGGYVIDFWGRGFDVAERMGLIQGIRKEGYEIQEMRIVNTSGRRVGGFDVDVFRKATQGRYVSLPRSALARLIYEKIEGSCEIIFGESIRDLNETKEDVEVVFGRGPRRRFDVVIGADGLHSSVRELAFGPEKNFEKFLGYTVAAFEAVGYRPRDEDVYINFSVPGKHVGRFTLRDNRTLFLFVFADAHHGLLEPQDIQAHKQILHSEFGKLGWECPQILGALNACDELYFDRVSQIRMEQWSRGRVGLIGDAAFCPSLLAGQGSALAMVSAYVLAGELGKCHKVPEEAFRNYERLLHRSVLEKQVAAVKFAKSFAPGTKLGLFLRNQATKVLGIPFLTTLLLKSTLIDRIQLPDYVREHAIG